MTYKKEITYDDPAPTKGPDVVRDHFVIHSIGRLKDLDRQQIGTTINMEAVNKQPKD